TYIQVIDFYKALDKQYTTAKLLEAGPTDVGLPLHVFVISADAVFNAATLKKQNKTIVLINNGIHAGEPCGIDASMVFAKALLQTSLKQTSPNTVICIIPVYNIDGTLTRGCCSRANQNGPDEYGFRGNYQNLDLNRDFIKADSENAKSFTKIFHQWQPHIFIDTHISNGADYAHNMTLIATQKDKLHPLLSNFMQTIWLPQWYAAMKTNGEPMCPYVDTKDEIPDSGLVGFFEPPRFASGYAALFNTWSFVSESHMLKPYHKQVDATITLLKTMLPLVELHGRQLRFIKHQADSLVKTQDTFPLQYQWQNVTTDSVLFNGYAAVKKISSVSNLPFTTYNQQQPYTKYIPYYNDYKPTLFVTKPKYYLMPQCFKKAVQLLQLNNIKMLPLPCDTAIAVTAYYIDDYKTTERPYEGHYLHSKVKLHTDTQTLIFFKGDYLIPTNQNNNYLVQVLEPQAADAFFA
ncbi:MAG TPA: M14 family zinc carboxypeptidase, partial [Bacteroidia bacterium]|nr:M14 family zinc carboxypeptidase [Bacteroidia bacterium]